MNEIRTAASLESMNIEIFFTAFFYALLPSIRTIIFIQSLDTRRLKWAKNPPKRAIFMYERMFNNLNFISAMPEQKEIACHAFLSTFSIIKIVTYFPFEEDKKEVARKSESMNLEMRK